MRYLLDTNVVINYLNRRSLVLIDRFLATPTDDIVLCSVVRAELRYGAMRSRDPQRTIARQLQLLDRFLSLPFCDRAADIFGEQRARLAKLGTPIGTRDLQIAAIALVHDRVLVTHNVREFERVQGLAIEDWEGT
ncbi:MAG: type II toxin-antitoxin system VapC family toxin [Coleofasciculaceae cyanobacterium RL_1_1]|nr:type II toxin-antitoxin system VapC family toxin [Coleofasciculaceae cyanobacterium RL_1_1]